MVNICSAQEPGIDLVVNKNNQEEDNKPSIFEFLAQEEITELTIECDLEKVYNLKKDEGKEDVKFIFKNVNGAQLDFEVKVEGRGKTRRRICEFPPLKISFPKKQLGANDLLKDHRKLKLVTHCNGAKEDEQNVLKEYHTYKTYNQITMPASEYNY